MEKLPEDFKANKMIPIFKIKIKAYDALTKEFDTIQEGLRPDTILYTGTAAVYTSPFGISSKRFDKALVKRFGDGVFKNTIPDNVHIIIFIKYDKSTFTTTHAMGTPGEHQVFHEEPFKRSLANFKEYLLVNTKRLSFDDVVMPVIKWLNDTQHPHVTVIITPTNAELVEGIQSTGKIMDYVKD